MGWEINECQDRERLPIDSRFIAKMEKGSTSKGEQVNSGFYKKWGTGSNYKNSTSLGTDERLVYNYVRDLVDSGQTVDPSVIEADLLITSDKFINTASKYYSQPTKNKLGEPVEVPAGSYVEGILANLPKKGMVRSA